jgi:hypothetical protein
MRVRVLAALAALALVPLAGCLDGGSDAGDGAPAMVPFVNPIILDHEHDDLLAHAIANNVSLVGHDYLGPNGPAGGIAEIDVAGDHAFVALMGYGFAIVDVSDPTDPELVSQTEYPGPATPLFGKYTADLKVDAAGDWVFLAMEVSATPGVVIYDTRDKAAPKLAGVWAAPGSLLGCHMVEYAIINEQEYLFCAPLDNAVWIGLLLPEANGVREVVTVGRWVPNSLAFVDQQVDEATAGDPAGYATGHASNLIGHQDMTYQEDPLTGAPTLYVSFWNLGMRIVDVSLPAAPVEVGSWAGVGAELYHGALHTSMAFASGDRRIVVTIPEGGDPVLFVLDVTELSDPQVLAQWHAYDDNGNASTFSLHNFQVVAGRVYLAMYHGGLFILDVSTPETLAAPRILGTYLPHMPAPDGSPYSPGIWDAVVKDGYILTGNSPDGFYVLHYDGDVAGNETHDSFA